VLAWHDLLPPSSVRNCNLWVDRFEGVRSVFTNRFGLQRGVVFNGDQVTGREGSARWRGRGRGGVRAGRVTRWRSRRRPGYCGAAAARYARTPQHHWVLRSVQREERCSRSERWVGFLGDTGAYPCHFQSKVGGQVVFDGTGSAGAPAWACGRVVPKIMARRAAGPGYVDRAAHYSFW
jgi:hypothetical protein